MQNLSIRERIRTKDLRVIDRGPLAYTWSSLAHYGLRAALSRRVDRNASQVSAEYDGQARSDLWKPDLSLQELIFGDDQQEKWISVDGKLQRGTTRECRRYLLNRLETRILELLPEGRGTVVEFGCGTGRNLFYLAEAMPELTLIGIELTPKTVEYARGVAKENGLDVMFLLGDMTAPPTLDTEVDVAYSVHALEQLPRTFDRAVNAMRGMARRGLVFFEPVHELFPKNALGLAGRFRIYNADYLNGLHRYLSRSNANIVDAHPMSMAGHPLNPTIEILVRTG